MSRGAIHFAAAAGVATAVLLLLAAGQRQNDRRDLELQRALKVARVVAAAAGNLEEEALQAAVVELPGLQLGVREALVLKGARLVADSDPARAGARLDRESDADKLLYDRSARLKATTRKNDEEHERKPELARDAYAEVEIEALENPARLLVAVPVEDEGGFRAMAQVEMLRPELPVPLPWLMALVPLVAAGLFWPVASRLRGIPLVAVGGLLLVAVLAIEARMLVDWRDASRRAGTELQATAVKRVLEAGLGPDQEGAPALASLLGTDEFHAPVGDIALERSLSAQVGEALNDAMPFDLSKPAVWRVTVPPAYLDAARARDVRSLTQWVIGIGALSLLGFLLGVRGKVRQGFDAFIEHRWAYAYLLPAMLGLLVLVFIPVVFGLGLGFMERRYNVFEFVGLENYIAILSQLDLSGPSNFYFTFGVTMMWTVLNVGLHVGIGLFLALMLNDTILKARGIYRVILIVPWAIPNYITALIWKGMFHKQFGAVNHFMTLLGLQPLAWFQQFWPAFSANVITNTWLGFPFMMVVSLGALQSIPSDLYEAAWVDGASRWQRFRNVTLPLLMPALVPAVILGFVWTFNMFNIIYLVSGGAPDGKTDILITEAFRWAFERDRYGYAAAYSTLIFLILLSFTLMTNRLTRATKSAFE